MNKLRFWRTVRDAYGFLFADAWRFVLLSGPWLGALAASEIAMLLVAPFSPFLAAVIGIIGVIVFEFFGVFAFSVAWHRAILLGETPRWALRFGRREWRFCGYAFVIGLIVAGIGGALVLALGAAAAGIVTAAGAVGNAAFLLPFAAWFVVLGLGARLLLALPAVAVDEPDRLLRTAWQRGRHNSVRLFFGPFVTAIPFFIIVVGMQLILFPVGTPDLIQRMTEGTSLLGSAILTWLLSALYFAQAAVTVGFLSYAYRQIAATTSRTDA